MTDGGRSSLATDHSDYPAQNDGLSHQASETADCAPAATPGSLRTCADGKRTKLAAFQRSSVEQESPSPAEDRQGECEHMQQDVFSVGASESRACMQSDAQLQGCRRCQEFEEKLDLENRVCQMLQQEVIAANAAKQQAQRTAEQAARQMELLSERCWKLQELVKSLQDELWESILEKRSELVLQEHRDMQPDELCCDSKFASSGHDIEPQPEPHIDFTEASASSWDLRTGDSGYLETPMFMDWSRSERMLQDECHELRLAEEREREVAEKHQDQVRRLQRSVHTLQRQSRQPRHAFAEAALAAAAEAKKTGVQRMKKITEHGQTSADFIFI